MRDVLPPLIEYLRNEFPTLKFYNINRQKEATEDEIPDNCNLVKDTGGGDTPNYRWVNQTVQIITRDIEKPTAKSNALTIYEKIHGRFGVILPQVTIKGIIYEQIETQQINGIQRPFDLGVDDNGRTEYATNYQLYYVGG
jgi:hypothetical protein